MSSPSQSPILRLKCGNVEQSVTEEETFTTPILNYHAIDENLLQKIAYDALVWSSLHGLVVGDKSAEVTLYFCFHSGNPCDEIILL